MEYKWFSNDMGTANIRHRLYQRENRFGVWVETPYFVDAAKHLAHFTLGRKYGLYGSGMGTEILTRNGSYRIAACFGGFEKIKEAKEQALTLVSEAK